jgi:threonine synthase
MAAGLRVPAAIGDFLVIRAVRESGGTAVTVTDDEMVDGMVEMARTEGVFAAPEGGATLAALRKLINEGSVQRDEKVVLLVTGNAHKYLDVLPASMGAE